MVTFIILLNVEKKRVNQVAERLVELKGISEVFSTSGRHDLVAIARVQNNDELATLVTEQMHQIDGILETETMMAFKAYSKHDLDSMFAI
ncbi:Lrp/AsnC family transcriptional regulator [Pokkaliibacter sp. CJK22405]|uniref:Lrp/AsnC family transcriptional regulator n=1 Tax=Pokkaliibacter sp. CJK22405 TaxID=3384615 RepID=UPI003984C11C